MKKITTEIFVARSNIKHNYKYDYSKSKLINNCSKIEIICPEHGSFWQIAKNHMTGHNCPKCSIEKLKRIFSKSYKKFIEQAKQIHGNKYNYDLVEYKSTHSIIKIICNIHGIFEQTAHSHLHGKGCAKCYYMKMAKLQTKSKEQFIIESNKTHSNKYNYDEVEYIGTHYKVKIICPNHGPFYQVPMSHIRGIGCKKCVGYVSKKETKWLNKLKIKKRNIRLPGLGNLHVDGYDPKTNTVYEFYGDYWHGNPNVYDENEMNTTVKKTFGELYRKTLEREELIKKNYKLITIWEKDYDELKKKGETK